METTRKVVLVASGSSPDRAIALERLLRAAAERSGWSERLEIRVGGIDGGAGRVSDAGLAALGGVGIDASGAMCPDLGRRPNLLEGAAVVVCDRGDVADVLVDWDETAEAVFVCVDELAESRTDERAGSPASEVGEPTKKSAAAGARREAEGADDEEEDMAIAVEVEGYADTIDEVLRRIVSDAPAA